MAQSCEQSSKTAFMVSFLAGLAVGVGAILLFETTLKEESSNDYESDELFV